MIEAVFFDVDGTLLSFETHTISDSTLKSINLLRDKGVKIFIATGRHKQELKILDTLVFDAYISLNGSFCYDNREKVIYKNCIPAGDMEALISIQQSNRRFPCFLATEDAMVLNFENDDVLRMYELINLTKVTPVSFDIWEKTARGEIFQLIAFFSPEKEGGIMSAMPGSVATRWVSLFADLVPKGISKQTGIDKVLEHYNIPLENTMAFGDGGNDIEMLKHVGLGVAMGNASDGVKQYADYVTDSVDNDGVYNALKYFGVLS